MKFGGEDSGYRSSGGLHGIGLKAANATSKYFKVVSYRDGFEHYIEYENGGKLKTPVTKVGKTDKRGTLVHITPDETIFDTVEYNKSKLIERLKEKAFLMKGLKFVVTDERDDTVEEIQYKEGIKEYLAVSNEDKKQITKIGFFEGVAHEINVEVALQWVNDYNDIVLAFTNNVKNPDFGTHVNGFRSGLLKAINRFAKEQGHLKAKDPNFQSKDVSEGLVGIVSVLVPENQLQFNSQTKDALNTPLAKNAVEEVLESALYEFLLANKKESEKLMTKVKQNQKARIEAKKMRDKQKKQKGKKNLALDKLTPASGKDVSKNELFVVEGDSAAGSAKSGRDRLTQGILALRGKVLNTENASVAKALTNAEIQTLSEALNVGLGHEYEEKDLKYDKLIIMTDADVDGHHITVLLLTLFFRHMEEFLQNGHVYIALAPLYKITDKKNNKTYVWNKKDLDKELSTTFKGKEVVVGRFKGLGEFRPA